MLKKRKGRNKASKSSKQSGNSGYIKPVIVQKGLDGKHKRLTSLERSTQLCGFIKVITDDGEEVGATLLNNGKPDKPTYVARFVWEVQGFPTSMSPLQASSALKGINDVLKEIPAGETLRVYYDSFADPVQREGQLAALFLKTGDDIQEQLVAEEIHNLQALDGEKKRRDIRIYIAATFTVDLADKDQDFIERTLGWFVKSFQKVSGSDVVALQRQLDIFIGKAYKAYRKWEDVLRDKLQTQAKPLNLEEIWQFCRESRTRFQDRSIRKFKSAKGVKYIPPQIPQYIEFNLQKGLIDEHVLLRAHPLSLIYKDPASIPATGRDHIFVDGHYVCPGIMVGQPSGFGSTPNQNLAQNQLDYLWKVICRPCNYDTRIVAEFAKAPVLDLAINNQDLVKQAKSRVDNAAKEGKPRDVQAEMMLEEALDVERQRFKGDPVMQFSLVVLPHRKTLPEARAAISEFSTSFTSPAELYPEVDGADALWMQSHVDYGKKLGIDMRDRTDKERSEVAASYFPLIKTKFLHSEGLEFIADDSLAAYYWNPFELKHSALYGKTRSGKSLLAAYIIYRALLETIKVTIMDRPVSDESSTFRDFTNKMGGDYLDIFHDSLNFLEVPIFSPQLNPRDRSDLQKQYEFFVIKTLLSMVLGANVDDNVEVSPQTVTGILTSAFKAFSTNPSIINRYIAAKKGGMGSKAWDNHPVVGDFAQFCSPEHTKFKTPTEADIQCFSFIRAQLKKWIDGPYGKTINSPSNVSIDSPLLTIALREMSNNDDAAVFSNLAYAAAMRRALSSAVGSGSLLFVDEASLALQQDATSNSIGEIAANGLKANIRLMLAAQEPGSVFESSGGGRIAAAISYSLVGRVNSDSLWAYEKYLNIPPGLLSKNANPNFAPDPATCSSLWFLKDEDTYRTGRLYFPRSLIYLTGSTPEERDARRQLEASLALGDNNHLLSTQEV